MKQIGLGKAMLLTAQAGIMSREARENLQQKKLRELINYAKQNSPYFARLYRDIPSFTPLQQIPPTTKKDLMANFDEWMTDRSISKAKVERFMSDLTNVGRKLEDKYLVYTTSGSTGNPCIVLYDDTTINVTSAIGVLRSFARRQDMKAFLKSGGRTMALFADNGFYLGCGSVHYNLRKMPWKKKQMRTCDVRKSPAEVVAELNAFQPSMLGSYPTALELLAAEQEKGDLNIHPAIIMTGGEQLTEDVRAHLTEIFGSYVQTNYSCTEGGTMACECTQKHFHINDDWVILEAVDEYNQPVPFGVQGAKVLLTNLANRICPIIRFEITDRVTIHNTLCPCGNDRPWLTLEGRTDDILTFSNDVRIAPLALYAHMKEISGIRRFQLIQQEADVIELRLDAQNSKEAYSEAKRRILQYLAQNGVEASMYLSEKPPEANPISGKFKHVIALK